MGETSVWVEVELLTDVQGHLALSGVVGVCRITSRKHNSIIDWTCGRIVNMLMLVNMLYEMILSQKTYNVDFTSASLNREFYL